MVRKLTLKETRQMLDMSKAQLSEASGISLSAINRIENWRKGDFDINEEAATLLANALACSVSEIEWPTSLSRLGRPPKTGVKLKCTTTTTTITEVYEATLCPEHFVIPLPSGVCPHCIE